MMHGSINVKTKQHYRHTLRICNNYYCIMTDQFLLISYSTDTD